jgi:hypothetical protein
MEDKIMSRINTILLSGHLITTAEPRPEVKRVLYFIEQLAYPEAIEAMDELVFRCEEDNDQ